MGIVIFITREILVVMEMFCTLTGGSGCDKIA